MSSRSRKKTEPKPKVKEEKINGKGSGPLTFRLDSCLNCETPLGNGTTKVAEFMLSFSETNKKTFSVLEALTAIFELSSTNTKFFPMLTTKNLVMCPSCATVLANLYKSYVELMQLSKATSNICKLVAKAEKWHENRPDFLSPAPAAAPVPSSEDEDDEEDSESDPEVKPKPRKSLKKEVEEVSENEYGEGDDEDDEDYDDAEYITPNGTSKKGRKSKSASAAKSSNKRRASKSKNGDYEESDEEYRGPKVKRKSNTSTPKGTTSSGAVDRGRIRERVILALDGTPRKRIRRRPSQTREDDYKCLDCDRIFKFECRLIKHMKTHMDKQRTQCTICEKSFLYSWMLENHVLAEHEQAKPTICGVCDLSFYRTEIFENHFCTPKAQQAAERKEKPHWCQLCGKSFQKLAHLTLHLRSHEDEKPLNCPECSQKFKYEKCLMKHMVVHNQEHVCPLCQKVFSHKSKLNAHMQTHDVVHPCPHSDCDKEFKQATALARHIKTHAGDEDDGKDGSEHHACENCSKAFNRKSDLSRHLRNQVCTKGSKPAKSEGRDDKESSEDEWEQEQDGQGSDGDSMSPGVSNSDNDNNVSLPSSPSPPHSPNLNLSEEDSNSSPPPPIKEGGSGIVLAMKSAPEPEDSFLSDKDSN